MMVRSRYRPRCFSENGENSAGDRASVTLSGLVRGAGAGPRAPTSFRANRMSAPFSFSWKDFPVPENHGSASAEGARTAVVSVRRVLLLLVLLVGALCALWIAGAHSAQAQERPDGSVDVLSAVDEVGATTEPLPLRESVPDTVTGVGERAVQAVVDTSETVAPEASEASEADVLVEQSTLGRQVREAGHKILSSAPEAQSGAEPRTEPVAPDVVEETSEGETPVVEDRRPAEREPRHEIDGDTDVSMPTGPVFDEADEHEPGEYESAASSSQGPTAGASGGSAGGSTTGGTVAGYLVSLGAPAPAPGALDAARHALRAVPTDTADESTFSPD